VNTPLYIESSPRTRARLIAVALLAVLVGVAFDHWAKPKLTEVAALPICDALPYVRVELVVGLLTAWFIGLVALKQGVRTWNEMKTPLPGTWVWSRTRVRTGLYARFCAILFLVMSAFFIFGPLFLVVRHQLYLVFCFPQACGC
jgi:hypothetical protein